MTKQPNSQECAYGGYKLSHILVDADSASPVLGLSIGCAEDDSFYDGTGRAGRVLLSVEMEDGQMAEIDFESLLVFARRYCSGIYDRVQREVTPVGIKN